MCEIFIVYLEFSTGESFLLQEHQNLVSVHLVSKKSIQSTLYLESDYNELVYALNVFLRLCMELGFKIS